MEKGSIMHTVTVTIGRNIDDEPMIATVWNDFVSEIRDAVEHAASEVWASAPYKGEWEGVKEDAFIVYANDVDDAGVEFLRNRLETLATKFRQDAIGLSVGVGELVASFQTAQPEFATV
jgi:hypothetical protein